MSSMVLVIFALSITLFQISCKKEVTAQTTTTALTKEQLLVQKTWEMDMVYLVIGCNFSSYVKGGANTTGANYDNIRLTFNSNGNGIHIDQFGHSLPFTWHFTSSDKRSLSLTVDNVTYLWDMVEIADNYLHSSVQVTLGGNSNNIETCRMKQIP